MLKRNKSERIEYWQFQFEDAASEPITTPHSWNAFDTMRLDEGWFRRGVGTYETDLKTAADKRTFVRFGAASQKAVVYWDGGEIGRNEGGYLPFTVELPQNSSGRLSVAVDNSPDIHLPPSDRSDFFLYGGLTRPVTLYTTGSQRIAQLQIDAQLNGDGGQLELILHVDGIVEGAHCTIRVVSPNGDQLYEQESVLVSAETALSIPSFPNPQRW